eukprot:3151169-Rhodomonas_salina.3
MKPILRDKTALGEADATTKPIECRHGISAANAKTLGRDVSSVAHSQESHSTKWRLRSDSQKTHSAIRADLETNSVAQCTDVCSWYHVFVSSTGISSHPDSLIESPHSWACKSMPVLQVESVMGRYSGKTLIEDTTCSTTRRLITSESHLVLKDHTSLNPKAKAGHECNCRRATYHPTHSLKQRSTREGNGQEE